MKFQDYQLLAALIKQVWLKLFPDIDLSESPSNLAEKLSMLVSDIEEKTIDRLAKHKAPITERTLRNYTNAVISSDKLSRTPTPKTLEILSRYVLDAPRLEGEALEQWIRYESYKKRQYWNSFAQQIRHSHPSLEERPHVDAAPKPFIWRKTISPAWLAITVIILLVAFFVRQKNQHPLSPLEPIDHFRYLLDDLGGMKSINTQYPCYELQGIWHLDASSKYQLEIPYVKGRLFYQSEKVLLYTWCVEDGEGAAVDGIEILEGEIRFCESEPCTTWEKMLLVGRITSIFRDEIIYDSTSGNWNRTGFRIGRYAPRLLTDESHKPKLDKTQEFLQSLTKTDCESIQLQRSPAGLVQKFGVRCSITFQEDQQFYEKWLKIEEEL